MLGSAVDVRVLISRPYEVTPYQQFSDNGTMGLFITQTLALWLKALAFPWLLPSERLVLFAIAHVKGSIESKSAPSLTNLWCLAKLYTLDKSLSRALCWVTFKHKFKNSHCRTFSSWHDNFLWWSPPWKGVHTFDQSWSVPSENWKN